MIANLVIKHETGTMEVEMLEDPPIVGFDLCPILKEYTMRAYTLSGVVIMKRLAR